MDQDRILTYFGVNPFSTNVLFMDKPTTWFLHKWDSDRKWVNAILGRRLVLLDNS